MGPEERDDLQTLLRALQHARTNNALHSLVTLLAMLLPKRGVGVDQVQRVWDEHESHDEAIRKLSSEILDRLHPED